MYAADGPPDGAKYLPWKSSLHMPRVASRLLLRVTDVRSEKLTDLSAKEARDEGCPVERLADSIDWFKEVWDSLFAARGLGWQNHPWVWVIAFEITSIGVPLTKHFSGSAKGTRFLLPENRGPSALPLKKTIDRL